MHFWNHLKWITDLGALLGQHPEGMDAASAGLLERARANGLVHPA